MVLLDVRLSKIFGDILHLPEFFCFHYLCSKVSVPRVSLAFNVLRRFHSFLVNSLRRTSFMIDIRGVLVPPSWRVAWFEESYFFVMFHSLVVWNDWDVGDSLYPSELFFVLLVRWLEPPFHPFIQQNVSAR